MFCEEGAAARVSRRTTSAGCVKTRVVHPNLQHSPTGILETSKKKQFKFLVRVPKQASTLRPAPSIRPLRAAASVSRYF
jgi:hypothetical protein